jgi:hypothetical protein
MREMPSERVFQPHVHGVSRRERGRRLMVTATSAPAGCVRTSIRVLIEVSRGSHLTLMWRAEDAVDGTRRSRREEEGTDL